MAEQFVTVNLNEIQVGEPLPCSVYVYIDFRFITYRAAGDTLDRTAYDRLEFKKVRNLFVRDQDAPKFHKWVDGQAPPPKILPEHQMFAQVREDVHRKTLDIFQSQHPDKIVAQTLESSKKLITEVMRFPYAVQTLGQLQSFSRGTVDHSVNVSILSVYLAMQMGYSHALILQHVGMGGLLHDIGKSRVQIEDEDRKEDIDRKMMAHADQGLRLIEGHPRVPNEVKMIIAQHHECHDGSGFPKKLRGSGIYDLARIVSIANVFDELVGESQGPLIDRQREAINHLEEKLYRKFDPQKLEKSIRILRLGV